MQGFRNNFKYIWLARFVLCDPNIKTNQQKLTAFFFKQYIILDDSCFVN